MSRFLQILTLVDRKKATISLEPIRTRKRTEPVADGEEKMPLRPPPLGEKPLWRTSSIRNPFQVTENSGYGEGVVSFTCVPGGAWGAPGNGGVPVLRGLGGGSGTALCFRSLVCFRAQPA